MKQYTHKLFAKILKNNGYYLSRCKGGHFIYCNASGHHISIPRKIASVIALRIIKENNLKF